MTQVISPKNLTIIYDIRYNLNVRQKGKIRKGST